MPANRYYNGSPSDHFDGVRFFNPGQANTDRTIWDLLRWQLTSVRTAWPRQVRNLPSLKPFSRVDDLTISMVGHASVLIQMAGINVLIDPVWSERASPVRWAGPKRVNSPSIKFEDLPPIDIVLITHNHYDHLDLPTLRRLSYAHNARFISPLGNELILGKAVEKSRIETVDWGDQIILQDNLGLSVVPAHHWSARGFGDRRMALWCGFVLQSPQALVYNVGDTGYGDGRIFYDIQKRFGSPDALVVPIGAYEPRWFMKDQHVNPEEAVFIMQACGAKQALGVHWGTFQLTDEGRLVPKEALTEALIKHKIDPNKFLAFEPGQSWTKPS